MKAWKRLEKQAAKVLGGRRILRLTALELSYFSCPDVELPEFPGLKIDAKYRARWAHHAALREVERKYCKNSRDVGALVTKEPNQRGAYATVRLEFLAKLLRQK